MPVFVIAEAAGRGPSVIPCFVRVVDATEKFGIQGFRGIRFHGKIQWPPSIFTELLCPELLACLSPYLAPLLAKPLLHNTPDGNWDECRGGTVPYDRSSGCTRLVRDFGQKEVRHYDSFGRPGSLYVDAAFRFLKDELNRLRSVGVEGLPVNLDEWSRDNRAAMPLQANGFDCGMFVIVDANFLSLLHDRSNGSCLPI